MLELYYNIKIIISPIKNKLRGTTWSKKNCSMSKMAEIVKKKKLMLQNWSQETLSFVLHILQMDKCYK